MKLSFIDSIQTYDLFLNVSKIQFTKAREIVANGSQTPPAGGGARGGHRRGGQRHPPLALRSV